MYIRPMKNYLKRWRSTWNPDMYHGWGRSKNYFEGWYFKIVDVTERYAFAFIPGISMGKTGESHAFIQVLDGKKCTTAYHRFDSQDFKPSCEIFEVQLLDNQFSTQRMNLNLPNVKGELFFENTTPLPKLLGAPGIMGWYSFVPFMECYHGIVSLNHSLKGHLEIDGEVIDFTNGLGYIEKDWGVSFPKGWFWLQTNHFTPINKISENQENISLLASVAHIPWLGNHFVGHLVVFWFQGKVYRFATYTGAKMKAQLEGNHIRLSFKDGKNQLDIEATKAGTGSLVAPIQGEMTGKVNESLQAIVHIRFYEKEKLIFEGQGRNAGLEAAGDVDVLVSEKWRR
jgi:tocopherol cyclase